MQDLRQGFRTKSGKVKIVFKEKQLWVLGLTLMLLLFVACKGPGPGLIKEDKGQAQPSQDQDLDLPDSAADLSLIVELLELDQPVKIFDKVHPESRRKYGAEQIIDRHQKIHQTLGVKQVRYTDLELLSEIPEQAKRIYSAQVSLKTSLGQIERKESFSLIYNPKSTRWELEWKPGLIIPGLPQHGTVRVRDLPAKRGEILDCRGQVLAANAQIYRLGIAPADLDPELETELAEFLDVEVEDIDQALQADWVKEDSFVPLATKHELTPDDYTNLRKFKLRAEAYETRVYPLGQAGAALIGYVGPATSEDFKRPEYADLRLGDYVGKAGLEAIFDQELRGKNGYQVYITGEQDFVLIDQPVVEGKNLQLTLDSKIQTSLHQELSKKGDAFFGLALDPEDGSIRAMISTPSYDPEQFVEGISSQDYQELLDNPDLPLYSKFSALYTPGSTHKLLSAMAFLSDGSISLEDKLTIKGKKWQANKQWGNYFVRRVELVERPLDLLSALVYSDNIFFAKIAVEQGADAYIKSLEKLGFGKEFKSRYPLQQSQISSSGLLETEVILADTAYGQGELLVGPAELAAIYSSILTGQVPEPKLFQDETYPSRATLDLSKAERKALASALRQVVTYRYPGAMERTGLEIAGKSGTAELGLAENGKMKYNNWFVGYNQKDPQIVFALCLLNAHEHEATYCHRKFSNCLELVHKLAEE